MMTTVPRTQRLTVLLLLNIGIVTALVVVGLAAHSLAVFAAGAVYLGAAAAIGGSLPAHAAIRAIRPSPRWSTPCGCRC